MKRAMLGIAVAWSLLATAPTLASGAAPTLGAVSATNIQGVSALLAGSVDPHGLATTYYFEYGTNGSFSGARKTAAATLGATSGERPVRAAISGLSPDTAYHFRLRASNASGSVTGTAATFSTTGGFGFIPGEAGLGLDVYADGGAAATQIGSHPYQLEFNLGFRLGGDFEGQPGVLFPDGDLRNLSATLPAGLIANPSVVGKCTLAQFHTPRLSPFEASRSGESCPDRSQIGTVQVQSSRGGAETRTFGLFNLDPAPGRLAQLGFAPYGSPIVFDAFLPSGPDGSYPMVLRAKNFPQSLDVYGLRVALWGTPWGASHNGLRGNCLNEAEPTFPWAKCSVGDPGNNIPLAYLTLPSNCSGALSLSAVADSWQQPAQVSATAVNRDSEGDLAELTGCQNLPFSPRPVAQLTVTKASSATGYAFDLTNDNAALLDPEARAPSQARKAMLRLPEGTTVNPSVGAGLGVCTPAQYALETATSAPGAGCPNASKIGDFTVRTPLIGELLDGAIFLAQPDDPATASAGNENPYDALVGVYLIAKAPNRGMLVRVPGKLVPDPATGTLTATFDGLPQLPYTDLTLSFRAGQRAPLISPPACGPASTLVELSPWSGSPAVNTNSFSEIKTGINGGPCPAGTPPFSPGAVAGGVNSNVNSYTPYFFHLTRQDTEQEITSYSLVLPKGITGKLAGIPFCPDAAIAAARSRRGAVEAANPSCPEASLVGHTLSGYGVGVALTYTPGRIYLAGPYHGQPLSVVTINPATVGPFDLGTVVVRSAFAVDEHTAQLRIDSKASDPIPHILSGIPLHLRDVRINMDRPNFVHNPSSCQASVLESVIGGSGARFDTAADDTTATASVPFQLLNCRTLGFRPRLGVRLRGGTRRGAFPQMRAAFVSRGPQDSNLKDIAVTIPHQLFLAQDHIRGICTRPQFAADRCPQDSVYGSAVAYTPLFDKPLRGDVYLRSAPHHLLPDLVASLHSGEIHIVLEGKIGPGKKGGIRAQFSDLPDEPLDRFVMTLYGGKRGLLVNSANICSVPPVSSVKALGQNNAGAVFTTTLRGQCSGKKGHKRHGGSR